MAQITVGKRRRRSFWGSWGRFTTTWAYFRLPETSDRTYKDLERMFAKKTEAKKFKKTVWDEQKE